MISNVILRAAKGWANYGNPVSLSIQRALRKKIITIKDRSTGLSFECFHGADRMFGEIFHSKVYDIPSVPIRPNDCVIDIGANHGFASCYFAHQGAKVFAVEPNPTLIPLLEQNIQRNDLGHRIEVLPCAVSGKTGFAEFIDSQCLGGGMSTINETFAANTKMPILARTQVKSCTLGDILNRVDGQVRMVKMDCEGSELEILKSMDSKTLQRINSFAIEYHPQAYDMSQFVDCLLSIEGFHISHVHTIDWVNANLHMVRSDLIAEFCRSKAFTANNL